MNVWPLLHRELLVSARRRSTRWLRVGVAAAAILLGAMFITSFSMRGAMMGAGMMGMALFGILVYMAFAVTGLFGVFFAADAISSERREGTLGLLFLTRLRGRDVVLGKLTSTTLRSAFALMAGLPMMALPLLLGGVTFKAYGYAALVLGNTLFLSVSAGLLVSSFNRQPVRAVMGTLLLVLFLGGVPPIADTIWADFEERPWEPVASYFSPAYSIGKAVAGGSGTFLWGVMIQHLIGWLFLSVAARRTGKLTEKIRQPSKLKAARWLRTTKETKAARKLRGESPIQWLISHGSRAPTFVALIVVALLGAGAAWSANSNAGGASQFQVQSVGLMAVQGLFYFIVLVWLTVEATRQTGDARRSGAFELLIATPLTTAELVSGFACGIWRIFAVAILTIFLLKVFSSVLTIYNFYEISLTSTNTPFGSPEFMAQQVIAAVFSLISVFATSFAVIWTGMWIGLRMESTTAAAALTFVLVLVVPTIVLSFAMGMLFMLIQFTTAGTAVGWISTLVMGMAGLLVNLGFIFWAHRQLRRRFREAANGTLPRRRKKRKNEPAPPGPPPLPAVS